MSAAEEARNVREAYNRFDLLRVRDEPFDEGDMQNVHQWMRAVTEWVEASAAVGVGGDAEAENG